MKNKKGFTLVELLAVIVILGVILIIAVPAVSSIQTRAKQNAAKDATLLLVKAIEMCEMENAAQNCGSTGTNPQLTEYYDGGLNTTGTGNYVTEISADKYVVSVKTGDYTVTVGGTSGMSINELRTSINAIGTTSAPWAADKSVTITSVPTT